jgi:hypothetical protein
VELAEHLWRCTTRDIQNKSRKLLSFVARLQIFISGLQANDYSAGGSHSEEPPAFPSRGTRIPRNVGKGRSRRSADGILFVVPSSLRRTAPLRFNAVVNAEGESSSRRFDHEPRRSYLQTPGKKQYDQDKENDSTDSQSAAGPKGVITAATAKQQKQDQDQ